jgi:hypothetical protein
MISKRGRSRWSSEQIPLLELLAWLSVVHIEEVGIWEVVPGFVCKFVSNALLMVNVTHVKLLLRTSASHDYMERSEKSYEVISPTSLLLLDG